jgi:DNA-binding NtrC family response regulator
LSQEALAALESYSFPGNVRELKNIIARALLESDGKEIQPEHLHFVSAVASSATSTTKTASEVEASEIPLNLNEAEVYLIKRALRLTGDNISEAARLLGISRKRIYRKLEQKT